MDCLPTQPPVDFDIDALRKRYVVERDKRLRTDGDGQYIETGESFSDYYEHDPYTPRIERDPIKDEIDVAILGAGFAGLLCAARMKEAGVEDLRIIDMAGDFGGTWYWNRYPGVQCDVDACCYVPLLEETGYVPKDRYAYGEEIFEQCQRIGRQFDLYGSALFGTMVRSLRWDETIGRWRVATDRGDDILARFVVMASGPYNRPKLPGIPGLESFAGHSFHSSRWDYAYTGGDQNGGLTGLADKKVGIIGTGATGVQIVPYVAQDAEKLYVFQRTPSTIDERGNRKIDPEWVKSLEPGWQAARQKNLHDATFEGFPPGMPDLVCDGWTEINRNLAAKIDAMGRPALSEAEFARLHEQEDYAVMERLRNRISEVVTDPETADALKPWYRFLCKRPCFNDGYLPAFNRDNVELVDVSASRGIERITPRGIVAGGREYDLDCIIYASGFEITSEMRRRIGIGIVEGRGGESLYDNWKDGFQTLYGQLTRGFPNMLFTGFIQGGVSVNVTAMYDQQARNLAYIAKTVIDRGVSAVEPSEAAQADWVRIMRESPRSNDIFLRECTPGYYNGEGGKTIRSHLGDQYGPGFYAFGDLLSSWRAAGTLEGLELLDR